MRKLILVLFLLLPALAFSQVNFQFIPDIYGRNVDGLLNCKIINTSGAKSVSLSIAVTERKSGGVVYIKTTPFNLAQGVNNIPLNSLKSANIQFYDNPVSVIIRHDHDFPSGDYEYCYTATFTGNNVDLPVEQCFNYQLIPFSELHLVEPFDRDSICEKRPLLTWQPLLPTLQGSRYQLVMTEVKKGQQPVEALNYNLPIVNQSQIIGPVLPYPAIAKELEEGKTYVWQVTAYKGQTILSRSEVWTLKVACSDKKKPMPLTEDGYRDIEDLTRGNYYIALGNIKLALQNSYNEQDFKYQVENLNTPGKKIKGLPKFRLLKGRNKILINLAETEAFTDGYSYLMKVWLPDGTVKTLRFIYKD